MEVERSPNHEATACLYIVHGAAYVSQHVKNPSKGPEIGRSKEVAITIELRYEPPFFQWIMEILRSTQWLEEAISKVNRLLTRRRSRSSALEQRNPPENLEPPGNFGLSIFSPKKLVQAKKVMPKRNGGATGEPSGVALEPKPNAQEQMRWAKSYPGAKSVLKEIY